MDRVLDRAIHYDANLPQGLVAGHLASVVEAHASECKLLAGVEV